MKIRKGYVSNSSSSSFLVTQDLTDKGVTCLKLSQVQKDRINGSIIYDEKVWLDTTKDFYLTEFISDGWEDKYKVIEGVEHILYQEGDLGESPRCEEYCNEYRVGNTSVYLLKEHDNARQMLFTQFAKEYKKMQLPYEVIVRYEKDGVKLLYV